MAWVDNEPVYGPIALPGGYDVTGEIQDDPETGLWHILGAAFRSENIIGSALQSMSLDSAEPDDPDYRAWEDIQGTKYEEFSDRFAWARSPGQAEALKARIDQELEDERTLAAAGWAGYGAQVSAAILSPTSLLPGGVLVKGAQGIKIGATGLSVATAAATAAAIDEAVLHQTQVTRGLDESAFAIGGSFILGGVLGAGMGKLSNAQAKKAAQDVELGISAVHDYVEGSRSLGAASVADQNLKLKNEGVLQAVKKVPGLKLVVESDPLIRLQTSDSQNARLTVAQMAESPSVYEVNDQGLSVLQGDVPVEARIKDRRYNEEAGAVRILHQTYGAYFHDGPVGTVGTLTAPTGRFFGNLTGRTSKMSQSEFFDEVGKAMFVGDQHPIPQVAEAASKLRQTVFKKAEDDLKELGMLPDDFQLKHDQSYFSRVYNAKLIEAHRGDKSNLDFKKKLADLFQQANPTMGRLEAEEAADGAIDSILGLKPGEHSMHAALSKPLNARVLDVASEDILPWLDTNAEVVLAHYMRGVIPDIEMHRMFGSTDMSAQIENIKDDFRVLKERAKSEKARMRIANEERRVLRDIRGIRDRLRNRYGLPDDPSAWWVVGGRVGRSLSYPAFLGNMVTAAIPDIANVIGRGGLEAAFTLPDFVSNPKRFLKGADDMAEMLGAAEWWLNGRAQTLSEVFDPMARGSRIENALSMVGSKFSVVSGMVPWNVAWKSLGGMVGASRLAKAVDAAAKGTATEKQMRILGQNYIQGGMVERIARQLDKHADKDGALWIPSGSYWTDKGAFDAFRFAMNREIDLMVVTPGQEVPLTFSNEFGKFFLQFKRFAWSMHHRLVLSGVSRADGELAAQVALLVYLGGLVSNLRADLGGYGRKEGAAFWEDAIDRSGVAGWLMEPYNALGAVTAGRTQIGGEPVSRFQSRSALQGLLGPTVDMVVGVGEGMTGLLGTKSDGSSTASYRDFRKLMRPIPGNNAYHLQWIFQRIEDALVEASGARPRS